MTEKYEIYENSIIEFDRARSCERIGCTMTGTEYVKMDAGFYGSITIWACAIHANELG
jgi:hypothetical protein